MLSARAVISMARVLGQGAGGTIPVLVLVRYRDYPGTSKTIIRHTRTRTCTIGRRVPYEEVES
eukprot:scaffold372388_cov34-Prasinocladus_malaysianus.AAC.1